VRIKRNTTTPREQVQRVEGREVDWLTRYRFEGGRDLSWRECRVRDVSREGAGVELPDTTVDEVSKRSVVLELEVPPACLRLRGDVRDARLGADGGVYVGVQFASLMPVERYLLDSLLK
jgi:hypothetical protein